MTVVWLTNIKSMHPTAWRVMCQYYSTSTTVGSHMHMVLCVYRFYMLILIFKLLYANIQLHYWRSLAWRCLCLNSRVCFNALQCPIPYQLLHNRFRDFLCAILINQYIYVIYQDESDNLKNTSIILRYGTYIFWWYHIRVVESGVKSLCCRWS